MGLKLTPTSFVAGVETQIFAYDFDHDQDDLSAYTDPQYTNLTFKPDGGGEVTWPVSKVEVVYGYSCLESPKQGEVGKAVGLLIYATPRLAGPAPGCLSVLFQLFAILFRIFRLIVTDGIGTGDLGGSTSPPTQPPVGFNTTKVTVK